MILTLHFRSICLTVLAHNWDGDLCLTDVWELLSRYVCDGALVELTTTNVNTLRSLTTLSVLH